MEVEIRIFQQQEGIDHSQGRKNTPSEDTISPEYSAWPNHHGRIPEEKPNPGRIPFGRGGPRVLMVNIANNHPEVNTFFYTDEILDNLEVSLSRERLGTYLNATDGDRTEAVRLHVRNTAISAAFYEPLQILEVTLRNAMNRSLSERYGDAWYDNDQVGLNMGALERISRARRDLEREGHDENPHRIVATLSFGFWVSLLGRGGRGANYEMTLWRPALYRTFPHCTILNRNYVNRQLNELRMLRNRIAHHEPIFSRNLDEEHERILRIIGWVSPTTRTWIEHHSRVPAVLDILQDDGDIRF